MGMLSTTDDIEGRFMSEKPANPDEPLWSLVDDGCHSTRVRLMGETAAERQKRHSGSEEPNGQTTLRELSDELNQFINKNRAAGHHDMLLTLVAAVSSEAATHEASKILMRQSKSSLA